MFLRARKAGVSPGDPEVSAYKALCLPACCYRNSSPNGQSLAKETAGWGRGMTEVALGSSSQDCHLETAEAWLEAGSGLSLQMGSLRLPLVPLCAHKDPRDSGQFQGVCGLQAQSPGLLSHELPSSALWASHVMLSAPLPSLRPSGRWEKHPAKADGHEAGDPAPQGPPAARLSSCSAPLSGPALPSLQSCRVLGGAALGPSNPGGRL